MTRDEMTRDEIDHWWRWWAVSLRGEYHTQKCTNGVPLVVCHWPKTRTRDYPARMARHAAPWHRRPVVRSGRYGGGGTAARVANGIGGRGGAGAPGDDDRRKVRLDWEQISWSVRGGLSLLREGRVSRGTFRAAHFARRLAHAIRVYAEHR